MPQKVGAAGQIINYNFVHEFVAENLNKFLWNMFTPGVLKLELSDPFAVTTEIEVLEFSGLIRPYYKDFLVKVDTMNKFNIAADSTKPYLVARMDWLTPPNGFDYESATYGTSGYSGYVEDYIVAVEELDPSTDRVLSTSHKLLVDDVVRFNATFGGITKDVDYYVIEKDVNSFKISTKASGSVLDITSTLAITNFTYRKMNSHIVRFDMLSESEINPTYDIVLVKLLYGPGGVKATFDFTHQTQVYLNDYCINYDVVERSGVRNLRPYRLYD